MEDERERKEKDVCADSDEHKEGELQEVPSPEGDVESPPEDDVPEVSAPAGESEEGHVDAQLRKYEEMVKEYHDRWLRAVAEFDNFRKRTEKEKEKYFEYALEGFLKDFLPVLDALEKGVEAAEKSPDAASSGLLEGVKLIHRNILTVLEKYGVKPIEAKGKVFDPYYHEAVSRVHTTEYPAGTVIEEYQRGYTLKDRVVRPSLVAVAVAPEVSDEKEGSKEAEKDREPSCGPEEEIPVNIIDEGSE